MTIFNLGSINIDHFYRMEHLPAPGETVTAASYDTGLGGKGANQSVAAALAGARVHHIGALGAGSDWVLERLAGFGVDIRHVTISSAATGHAVIAVDRAGENAIIIHPGANREQDAQAIGAALDAAQEGDTLMLQNETSHQPEAARMARARGMRLVYSAAPFDVAAVQAVLPMAPLLVMNAIEAAQLQAATGSALDRLPVAGVVVTRGAEGAEWISEGNAPVRAPAFRVSPVDTTGAGDCFAGSLAAALDMGVTPAEAMRYASAAAALQVTRKGTADAMPARAEVEAFLREA